MVQPKLRKFCCSGFRYRGFLLQRQRQLVYGFYYGCHYGFMVRHLFARMHQEQVNLPAGRYGRIHYMLVQPPRLHHQPAYAVAVYRAFKFLLRYRKARHGRRRAAFQRRGNKIYQPDGKNRKRFPFKEKRINMLLSLEPLIYLESITNGELIKAN